MGQKQLSVATYRGMLVLGDTCSLFVTSRNAVAGVSDVILLDFFLPDFTLVLTASPSSNRPLLVSSGILRNRLFRIKIGILFHI